MDRYDAFAFDYQPGEIRYGRNCVADVERALAERGAERALIVLSGPSAKLSRRGFESARHWLEEETDTVEVRAGDEPIPGSSELTATVALSNVTDVPRIDAIQDRAVAYQKQLTR